MEIYLIWIIVLTVIITAIATGGIVIANIELIPDQEAYENLAILIAALLALWKANLKSKAQEI